MYVVYSMSLCVHVFLFHCSYEPVCMLSSMLMMMMILLFIFKLNYNKHWHKRGRNIGGPFHFFLFSSHFLPFRFSSPYPSSPLPFPSLSSLKIQLGDLGERCKRLTGPGGSRPPNGFWCIESSYSGISGCSFVVQVCSART